MAKKKPTKKKAVSKDAVDSTKDTASFEESLEALKEILGDLEEGNLPLSESLEKYESGVKHLRSCHDSLKHAKARIELLVKVDSNGKAVKKPFDHSATMEDLSSDEANALQSELDEETSEDGDWDGGLF